MLVGGAVFGIRWFERADPFEVYFGLVARLSPWGAPWRPDGGGLVVVRNPLDGLDGVAVDTGLLAVVSVLLGSTAFDSFAASTYWLEKTARPGASRPGAARHPGAARLRGAGGACRSGSRRWLPRGSAVARRRALPRLLAHSLVPIIVGYVFAHYLTLPGRVRPGGAGAAVRPAHPRRRLPRHGRPRGALRAVDAPDRAGASIKVAAIVTGHVLAVVAAHDRAVRLLPARHAVVGQLAMLLVMVGYTVGGLLLLFNA